MRVCIGTALLFSYLLRYSNLRPTLRGGNRLGASPERLSDLLTVRQSCRSGTSSSSLSLSIPSLFLPQASTPLPRILSSCGCLDTGAPSGRPSRPPGWVGTRPQAPGQGAPELAERLKVLLPRKPLGGSCINLSTHPCCCAKYSPASSRAHAKTWSCVLEDSEPCSRKETATHKSY